MSYSGYLLKAGSTTISERYMANSSYKCAPAQRTDVDSGMETADGVLHRTVLDHTRSKVEFTTPHLKFADMEALMSIIEGAFTDTLQRKLNLTYYITGSGAYGSGEFYLVQPEYTIYSTAAGIRMYLPTRIAFVEY